MHAPTTLRQPITCPQMLAPVLQMDVWLDPAYVCALYDSCKGTNAVAQVKGIMFWVDWSFVRWC